MQQNTRSECPKCSRPLRSFNGHIGYCPQHKWISPLGLGFEAEAAERNRQDADAAEQSRLEQLRQQEAAKAQEMRERHQSALRKAVAVVIALAAIAAAVVFFVVRPSISYRNAASTFAAGDYQAARSEYAALGDYKDSEARTLLCDAMADLQEDRPEAAAEKLDQLTGGGQSDVARQLTDTLLPMVANWKNSGLSPQALLLLLSRADLIDPDGTLDVAELTLQGHTALLDGTQLSTYAGDVDGDGQSELIVLSPDYTVTVYRMTADSNVPVAVDNDVISACEMAFGNGYLNTDADASVACFAEAHRLSPSEETRSALTNAYQLRSAGYENAGAMDAAIADAKSAMETAGTEDAFRFFYDINLRNCKNGHDAATAIALWDEFAASCVSELTRFSGQERWQADAAQLHIARAAELAAQKDAGCIAQLRNAADLGADVTSAIAEAESHFEPGLSLAHLRLMEIDLLGDDAASAQQIRADMAAEVRTAISEWSTRGLSPADVPALIQLSDEQGIDLSDMDREGIYEATALAAAGEVVQYTFADWNGDGYEELFTLTASGALNLYGMNEAWGIVSSMDTKLPGASYTIADERAPLILVLASGADELLAVTSNGDEIAPLFRETGISRYAAEGTTITFSRLLEGSIVRYNDYTYDAVDTANRPVRTGMDWQQNDYPQPADAAAAIQRYFEARAYDIPDEAARLTGIPAAADGFTPENLAALPTPDAPASVSAAPYLTQEYQELFEVTYCSGGQSVRSWISAEYVDGWRLTGAADTYGAGLAADNVDFSIPLISLNVETEGILSTRGERNTYRLLVPTAGRAGLIWQSGSKAVSRTSHTVSMYRGSLSGDSVFSYPLQPSPNRQLSKDMFLSAGVYYVTVEANLSDAEPYHLTITFDAQSNVELENNDVPERATAVELNTSYSGMLSSAKDVDYYSFTLDATSAVNVTFATPGQGGKTATHTLAVLSAANGSRLSTVSVPGNAQLSETGNLYLSPGTYLVQVAKGSAFTSDEYNLTVQVEQNGVMESEPNNTPETANSVPVNEDIHASIGQEGDVDCFNFTLDTDAVVQPKLTFAPTGSASKTYVLTILDDSLRELFKVNIGGKESTKVIAPVALSAGAYTVRIENPRFIRQDYTLCLVSMAVDAAENEPNDTAALATALAVGQPRTGVLSTDSDVDYYRVTFAEPVTVTLSFAFAQSTSTNTAFVLNVEQNGKTQWSVNIKGDSGGIAQQLQFPAGEYYLRVKPSTWLSAVYTLTLE